MLVGEWLIPAGDKPIVAGKQRESELMLIGERVSRVHCRLLPADSGWRIEDHDSTNGVFVNGERIASCKLDDGDRIRIGDYELVYSEHMVDRQIATADVAGDSRGTAPQLAQTNASADDDGIYQLAEVAPTEEHIAAHIEFDLHGLPTGNLPDARNNSDVTAGLPCPGCRKPMPASAKICVDCGINLKTGRSILTTQETNLDVAYSIAEETIRWLSWVFWTGIYPIASEAFGTRKPWAIRGIAIVTVLTSVWFLIHLYAESPQLSSLALGMLWAGDPNYDMNRKNHPTEESDLEDRAEEHVEDDEFERAERVVTDPAWLAMYAAAGNDGYRTYQLITHAFLHAGFLHLAGNMLFFLLFGSRVNALIGNLATVIVYPLLAIGGGLVHMASLAREPMSPALGASGAVMGLAGMYMVLFPVHNVHMAAWFRWANLYTIFTGDVYFWLKLWTVRGVWVVLFYIGFDVFYTLLGVEDGVAHWAHLGGFLVGVGIALLLLVTRAITARGGDIISVILGRHAWAVVGRPNREPNFVQRVL
jgi:membrane associated rhomboid family serine protease